MILFFAERENHHWDTDDVSNVEHNKIRSQFFYSEFDGHGKEFRLRHPSWAAHGFERPIGQGFFFQTRIRAQRIPNIIHAFGLRVRRTLSRRIGFLFYNSGSDVYKILHAGLSSV